MKGYDEIKIKFCDGSIGYVDPESVTAIFRCGDLHEGKPVSIIRLKGDGCIRNIRTSPKTFRRRLRKL